MNNVQELEDVFISSTKTLGSTGGRRVVRRDSVNGKVLCFLLLIIVKKTVIIKRVVGVNSWFFWKTNM